MLPMAHMMKVRPNTVSGMFLLVILPRGVRARMWSGITYFTAMLTPAR